MELPCDRARDTAWSLALRLRASLPTGRTVTAVGFENRHRRLLLLLWLHVPCLSLFALWRGFGLAHSATEGALIATFAVLASLARGRDLKAVAVALGLVTSSSVLVHIWGGAIEGHFHFFVVMTFLALYQSWLPFLTALAFVVIEHGLLGALAPSTVYDHADAIDSPWTWALIHGGFVLASCAGNLFAWRLIENEALHDSLTGLPNRARFFHELDVRTSSRRGRTAVMFLDLDDFKSINDEFGHEVGDALLTQAASRLQSRLRRGDLLARLGGDEFAAILTAPSSDAGQAAGERLLAAFDEPFQVGDLRLAARASAGISTAGAESTPRSLLREADMAMYASKRAKRVPIQFPLQRRPGQARGGTEPIRAVPAAFNTGRLTR